MSWSYLYLGTIALIKANNKNKNKIFDIIQIGAGTKFKWGKYPVIGNHPPKKSIEPIAHIKSIFAYSPSQNIAYIIPEYSV